MKNDDFVFKKLPFILQMEVHGAGRAWPGGDRAGAERRGWVQLHGLATRCRNRVSAPLVIDLESASR